MQFHMRCGEVVGTEEKEQWADCTKTAVEILLHYEEVHHYNRFSIDSPFEP
jgi:hypothetical protein